MLKINEIFYSIQGESTLVGWPTVFIRTTGCNLRCTYCDTKYSYYEGQFQTEDWVFSEVAKHPTKHVCITGGEPLLQKEVLPLMSRLSDAGYQVSLETSGSKSLKGIDPRVLVVLDVKTPDSGAADSFLQENLSLHEGSLEFKFVITSQKDFDWAENFCRQTPIIRKPLCFIQPIIRNDFTPVACRKYFAKKITCTLAITAS